MKRCTKLLSVLSVLLLLAAMLPLSVYAATLKITTQPQTTYASYGAVVKTAVKATGDGLKYTWYYKNPGATKYSKSSVTNATYSTTMSDKSDGRYIYCVVKDKKGKTVKSNTVILRMKATVTTEPTTTYAKQGETAKATVKAKGNGLKYTWYVKNAGATKYSKSSITSSTYSVKMSDKVHGRYVYCVVTDKYGKTDKSKTVVLRQSATIVTEPKSTTVAKGKTATLTVKAVGEGLKYTWYVKNAGATKYSKSSITKSTYSVTMSDTVNGRYAYCVVTDKYGKTAKSKTVVLKQSTPLTITMQPENTTAAVGDEVGFGVVATGGVAPYTYRWVYVCDGVTAWTDAEGEILTLGNQNMLSFTVEQKHFDKQYLFCCFVTDAKGNEVTSRVVWIEKEEVTEPLTIDWQTSDIAVNVGDQPEFAVGVSGGTEPYSYRWQYLCDGMDMWQDLDCELDIFALTVQSTHFDNHYQYRCIITDAEGEEVISEIMRPVENLSPLVIVTQPRNVTAQAYDRVSFCVLVTGGKGPYTYEWQYMSDTVAWTPIVGDWADGMGTDTISFGIDDSEFSLHYKYRCVITDANGNKLYSEAAWVERG